MACYNPNNRFFGGDNGGGPLGGRGASNGGGAIRGISVACRGGAILT